MTEQRPYAQLSADDDDTGSDDDDSGADDDDSGADDDDDSASSCDLSWLVVSEEPVSLADDIEPIFFLHCDDCHTTRDLGGLNLSPGNSYAELVGEPNLLHYGDDMLRVEPGNPQGSYLMHKIIGCEPDDPVWGYHPSEMPPLNFPGTQALSQEQISLIYSWILQGAPEGDD